MQSLLPARTPPLLDRRRLRPIRPHPRTRQPSDGDPTPGRPGRQHPLHHENAPPPVPPAPPAHESSEDLMHQSGRSRARQPRLIVRRRETRLDIPDRFAAAVRVSRQPHAAWDALRPGLPRGAGVGRDTATRSSRCQGPCRRPARRAAAAPRPLAPECGRPRRTCLRQHRQDPMHQNAPALLATDQADPHRGEQDPMHQNAPALLATDRADPHHGGQDPMHQNAPALLATDQADPHRGGLARTPCTRTHRRCSPQTRPIRTVAGKTLCT
jgi:hypothetical protein